VQEHDPLGVLDRVEMEVRAPFDLGRQRRQLEVVRREEREAAVFLRERSRDRPGERETVERRRAPADFVDQHEALRRCAMENRRGFCHLDHERRAPAGQVVGRADPRVDRVESADLGAFGRNERAAVGEERNHRGLSHIRRLAAHVRSRDDQQPADPVRDRDRSG
jgi:hypothetical protein